MCWYVPQAHPHEHRSVAVLVQRLTRAQREIDERETDEQDTVAALDHAIQELLNGDVDLDQHGYACTVAVDPDLPVTYRITRILRSDCDGTHHS